MVRDLVGKNLFSGAINWQDGVLYSKQASQMKADREVPQLRRPARAGRQGRHQVPVLRVRGVPGKLIEGLNDANNPNCAMPVCRSSSGCCGSS